MIEIAGSHTDILVQQHKLYLKFMRWIDNRPPGDQQLRKRTMEDHLELVNQFFQDNPLIQSDENAMLLTGALCQLYGADNRQ